MAKVDALQVSQPRDTELREHARGRTVLIGSALKRTRVIEVPDESDLRDGVELLFRTAKIAHMDRALFKVIIRETADFMKEDESDELGLTAAEAQYLVDSGDFTPEEFAETAEFVRSGGLSAHEHETNVRALMNTFTTAQVAELLGIDESSVRHRVRKNTLFSFLVDKDRFYPKWQFLSHDDRVAALPSLAPVVSAIPKDWTPADVEGFMTTPQDDLVPEDEPLDQWMTPIQWLVARKGPEAVVEILEETQES